MKIDKIYIIHYTRLTSRKDEILRLLKDINIPYEFITEFDRDDFTDDILKKYYDPDPIKYRNKSILWGYENEFRILNNAEISSTIKHITALDKISKECDVCGLILEDDIVPLFIDFLEELNNSINESDNWDVIYFGKGIGDDFIKSKTKTKISENLYLINHPASNCGESYCVRKEAARKIVNSVIPFQNVSDWEFAHSYYINNLNIVWRLPSIFDQGSKNGIYKSSQRDNYENSIL